MARSMKLSPAVNQFFSRWDCSADSSRYRQISAPMLWFVLTIPWGQTPRRQVTPVNLARVATVARSSVRRPGWARCLERADPEPEGRYQDSR